MNMYDRNAAYLNSLVELEELFSENIRNKAHQYGSLDEYLLGLDEIKSISILNENYYETINLTPVGNNYEVSKESYKPSKIRNKGISREGYCEKCKIWLKLKTSSYWYHMNFKHGINSFGQKYPEPDVRVVNMELIAFCSICNKNIVLGSQKNIKSHKFSWYKHWQKSHRGSL